MKTLFAFILFLTFATTAFPMEDNMEIPVLDQTIEISTLKQHFLYFYQLLAEKHPSPGAFFKESEEMHHCFLGLDNCYHNMIMGYPPQESHWEAYIEEQLAMFQKAKTPFVWYIDKEGSPHFKEKLIQRGFKEVGVFRGVAGVLDPSLFLSEVPSNSTLECVQDTKTMDEWADLVCATFGIDNVKEAYKKALWELATEGKMYHWLARKEGKAVSALSTIIQGNLVSFWNGASLPTIRKQGYSTALRQVALQHAIAQGCQIGSSYLMAEGLAYGICHKLGYDTKWRFDVFAWDPSHD